MFIFYKLDKKICFTSDIFQDYDGELCRKALLRDGHPAALAMSGAPPMHGLPPPIPGPLGPLPPLPPPMALGPPALRLPKLPPVAGDVVNNLKPSGPIGKTVFVANVSNFFV